MMEIDDKALRLFMKEQKQEVEDKGFSRKVINRLPNRGQKLSTIWVTFCSILGVTLFFSLNGLHILLDILREAFISIVQSDLANLDPKAALITLIVLVGLGVHRVCSIE